MTPGFQNDNVAWLQVHDLSSKSIDAVRILSICDDRPITAGGVATISPAAATGRLLCMGLFSIFLIGSENRAALRSGKSFTRLRSAATRSASG
jgi:hypothetical protein